MAAIGSAEDENRDALHDRIAELDQNLEQALVATENAQEESRVFAEEHVRMRAQLASKDREIAELHARLAISEDSRKDLVLALRQAHGRLARGRTDEAQLSEALNTSFEELRVLAEELEQANVRLEQRVQERTAELAAANAALRGREEQLRLAQKCAGAGAWDWDVPTGRMGWSPECHDVMGLDPRFDRPSLDRVLTLLHPDDRNAFRSALEATLAGSDDEFRAEFRIRHPERAIRWIASQGRVARRDPDGRPTRVGGLFIDITDRKALEDTLRRAREEAVAADRAKTRFLAAASHDLRQPIQAATLYTHVLRTVTEGNRRAWEALDLLKLSIESVGGMLDSLLDLSRLDAGAVEVRVVDFVPADLMRRLHAEFNGIAAAAGAELRCLPATAPVSTDPQLLERVLRNLLANAVAHGVTKPNARILLGCRNRNGALEFQVVDNGSGIPPEAHEAIFEEFRQLRNPERDARRGFGLGLSIVSRIARLLGARIDIRSRPGCGSVFSIAVPRTSAPAVPALREPAPDGAAAMRLKGRVVLLVEDDAGVRQGLSMMLKGWGVRVIAVASTAELEAKLQRLRTRPHALVTDYRLPDGLTGRTVFDLTRRRWDLPCVIITGDTAPERLREARSIGCCLLHKPVDPDELARALETAISA